jgi:hypothetical protein
MKNNAKIESDGTLLPMGAIAVFPCCMEDLAELVRHGELASENGWVAGA